MGRLMRRLRKDRTTAKEPLASVHRAGPARPTRPPMAAGAVLSPSPTCGPARACRASVWQNCRRRPVPRRRRRRTIEAEGPIERMVTFGATLARWRLRLRARVRPATYRHNTGAVDRDLGPVLDNPPEPSPSYDIERMTSAMLTRGLAPTTAARPARSRGSSSRTRRATAS